MSPLTLNTLDQFNIEGLNHQDMFCSQIRLFTHHCQLRKDNSVVPVKWSFWDNVIVQNI